MVGRYNASNQAQSSEAGQPYIGTNGRDRYIGVEMTIPFFEGYSRTYKIRSAQAQLEGKQVSLADAGCRIAGGSECLDQLSRA
ncbi:TolC family protein [Solimicrobium silvestre]|uniref:TolC family protein n=1 Tax=Solimicrobium silvestre TaxID=2099400 RepID=UPI0013FE4779